MRRQIWHIKNANEEKHSSAHKNANERNPVTWPSQTTIVAFSCIRIVNVTCFICVNGTDVNRNSKHILCDDSLSSSRWPPFAAEHSALSTSTHTQSMCEGPCERASELCCCDASVCVAYKFFLTHSSVMPPNKLAVVNKLFCHVVTDNGFVFVWRDWCTLWYKLNFMESNSPMAHTLTLRFNHHITSAQPHPHLSHSVYSLSLHIHDTHTNIRSICSVHVSPTVDIWKSIPCNILVELSVCFCEPASLHFSFVCSFTSYKVCKRHYHWLTVDLLARCCFFFGSNHLPHFQS